MRRLLTFPVFLVAATLAAEGRAEKEIAPTAESKALNKLLKPIGEGNARAARQAYEQLAKDFPGKEVADEAAWYYACFHVQHDRLDEAQALLLSLKRSGRENGWVSKAVLGLSEVARKRGDERAMIGYLEEAIKMLPAATERNLMDTLDTCQEAFIRLARHYRDKGDFKKALDYFTRWEPQSWCGSCLESMEAERKREIAWCQLRLGDHGAVVRDRFHQLHQYAYRGGFNGFDAWVLCREYRDAGQLDDLRRILDEFDRTRKRDPQHDLKPTAYIRELIRIESLAQHKDVAALVAICQDHSKGQGRWAEKDAVSDPVRSTAAEALAALDGIEAVKAALAEKPYASTWLIYSLGRSSSPAALEVLTTLAEQQADVRKCQDGHNIAYALALRGEPGKRALKRLAERDNTEFSMAYYAKDWVNRVAKPAWPQTTGPRPKAGSLPKTLPGSR